MAINELSAATFTVTPLDEAGQPRTPASARYRLDDKVSQQEVIAWTVIATLSTEMTISVPASAHAMVDVNLRNEPKVLTVETDYSTDDAHREEFEYKVRNLQFVS